MVAPKRAALAEANKKLEAANKKLSGIRARVKEVCAPAGLLLASASAGWLAGFDLRECAVACAAPTNTKRC